MIRPLRRGRCRELVALGVGVALLLCVSLSASAQLIEVPPRRTAANLPPPNPDRAGRTYAVIDGCTPTDCTVGGCPYPLGFRVHCMDQGDSWVATASAGTASFGVVNTPGGVSLVAYGAGETLTFAVVPPMSIAGDADTDTVEWSIDAATTSAPGAVQLAPDGGTTAGQAIQASDSRLVNARTPTAHEATHRQGGSDALGGTLAVSITGNATTATSALTATTAETALAATADPANCLSGLPRGVDASWVGQGCADVALGTDTSGSYAAGDAEAGNATGLACSGCVDATDIAADAVTAAKVGFNYAGSASEGGAADSALAVSGFTGSRCARFDGSGNLVAASADCSAGDTTGALPDGSGSELQFRSTGSALGAVTSSSVSGADVTLGGLLTLPAAHFLTVASAVNYVEISPQVTGGGSANGPTIKATGSDASVDLNFDVKGTGPRYQWKINGTTKMDYTDIGSGQFALRNSSGPIQVNAGQYVGQSGNNVLFGSGGNWTEIRANGTVQLRVTSTAGVFSTSVQWTPIASPPYACVSAAEGSVYYDSTDHDFCRCKGAGPAWVSDSAGTCS